MNLYKLTYVFFPLIIVFLELALRLSIKKITNVDIDSRLFLGPALSASSLSILLPILEPKVLELKLENKIVTSTKDSSLIFCTFFIIIIGMFVWLGLLTLVLFPNKFESTLNIDQFSAALGIGFYFLSCILATYKDYA